MNDNYTKFFGDEVRRIWHQDEWWFLAIDIIKELITNETPENYLQVMKITNVEFNKWFENKTKKLNPNMDYTNLEGVFRIIQSINTQKAEHFKLWMAQLAKKRIDELAK